MPNNKNGKRLLTMAMVGVSMLLACPAFAQTDDLQQARTYLDSKQYDKAIDIYARLYAQQPGEIYDDYLDALIKSEDYKDAEKLVNSQLQGQPQNPMYHQDMGRVYEAAGKGKKANEEYEATVQLVNGNDIQTQRIANTFVAAGNIAYAIKTYERAAMLMGNGYLYGPPLAKLYAQAGDIDKAVDAMLAVGPIHYPGTESTESMLLQITNNDPQKITKVQKALVKKINEQPDNTYYSDLLTWVYTQKNDWDGALIQIEALDLRNREDGHRLMDFARDAVKEKQYEIAVKVYDEVLDKGKDQPFYTQAAAEKLNAAFIKLQNDPNHTAADVSTLAVQYDTLLRQLPNLYSTQTARDYATLEAQYAGNPQKGIDILQAAISMPSSPPDFIGACKLQLGDYYVLAGKIWDASLMYSQVDKAFKQDAMGEDARFRNAKLAYYRGDFEWAQDQLTVLKSATSDLIANDALYLSVLITENVGADSNLVPLKRFAYADLLLFQNKDKEAEALLDSISAAFPKHALNDDILMLRAKIAEKHYDYTKALSYLKEIYEKYGKDVLGDDAVFMTAELYEDKLHQPEQAKHFYEQLILDYPGSTYVQEARKRLDVLGKPVVP